MTGVSSVRRIFRKWPKPLTRVSMVAALTWNICAASCLTVFFKRYGDVAELKAEKIDDDSALKGKWALFAKITPTDDLIAMNKAAQKVYTSMEIQPNFANTGKCYLVGLAVTDDPASLGTEYTEFCRTAKHNP